MFPAAAQRCQEVGMALARSDSHFAHQEIMKAAGKEGGGGDNLIQSLLCAASTSNSVLHLGPLLHGHAQPAAVRLLQPPPVLPEVLLAPSHRRVDERGGGRARVERRHLRRRRRALHGRGGGEQGARGEGGGRRLRHLPLPRGGGRWDGRPFRLCGTSTLNSAAHSLPCERYIAGGFFLHFK